MIPLTDDIADAWYSDDFGGSGELEIESDADECEHDDYGDE